MTAGNQRGQTMVEIALILLLIAVALVAGFNTLQGGLTGAVNNSENTINAVTP